MTAPARVVLVTGVSQRLGSRLAARLVAEPDVERVIGVDTTPPRQDVLHALGRTEFVRADIRNPLIAKVIAAADVDTVVHLSVSATPRGTGGRSLMKEINVIGTMQLLAACQKAPSLRRLVAKSTTAIYGSSPRDPAAFTEDTQPKSTPRAGYAKDATEVEAYVRGFERRRPDVDVCTLRFANFMGPRAESPLTSYFALPVVPQCLGFDPRLQFVHEDDAVEVLRRAVAGVLTGTVNVAGEGVLLLSQAIRRAGRVPLPVPAFAVTALGRAARQGKLVDFSAEQVDFLLYGRVVDTTRLTEEFGYVPRRSTVQAFDEFVRGAGLTFFVGPGTVETIERQLLNRLTSSPAAGAADG